MRWEGQEQSSNVEDIRGLKPAAGLAFGGAGILVLIVGYFLGVDPNKLKQLVAGMQGGGGQQQGQVVPVNDGKKEFFSTVFRFTEKVWDPIFKQSGKTYEYPKMKLFSQSVQTACGNAPSAVGPFYCPGDKTVYLDPTFFDELEHKLGGSKAEFSQAYVIAHEVGHHVQNLLGYSKLVDRERGTRRENEFSVRLELQADYLAGVWANKGRQQFNFIEPGDFESAITSAKAIGDDVLQKRSGGFAHPEKFTHGTAKQRVQFFELGFKTGNIEILPKFFEWPYVNGELQVR